VDTIDRAQDYAARFQRDALTRQLSQQEAPEALVIDGHRCCVDCERPIPSARLERVPGAVRCVRCQARHERGRR